MTSLTPEAKRRLQAIENFSDLGSGIHIAMQDLDIRGAGNMLGAEQSGFIADLGYETYQKILAEAVKELKEDEFADLYAEELQAAGEEKISGENFVDECQVESDLELLSLMSISPAAANVCCFIVNWTDWNWIRTCSLSRHGWRTVSERFLPKGWNFCVSYLCADWLNGWGWKSILESRTNDFVLYQ